MSDLLPPGNMPAPNADGDDTRDFPGFFASDMWPSLWPRLIHRYATTAARDADLAGLGAADRAFAWVDASGSLTAWTGAAWSDTPTTVDTGWVAATLSANWTNVGGYTARYRRVNGRVEVGGMLIRGAGAGSTFFTLPAGFRPSGQAAILGSFLTDAGVGYDLFADTNGEVGFASSGYVTGSTAIGGAHPLGGSFRLG